MLDLNRMVAGLGIMVVERLQLGVDTIDLLPQTGDKGIYLKQHFMDKVMEYKQYTIKHGQDLPEI